MKKKFLSTLIIGGILCSGNTLVFAKENPKSNSNQGVASKAIVKNTNKASNDNEEKQYTAQQLSYSIEEMREADSILNSKDLTNSENYNRMLTFASTSLDRIRSLKDENLTEEMNTHIDFISSIGEEIRQACNNSNELIESIRNVEKTFSNDKHFSIEEKENALYKLNDIIIKNVKEDKLNQITLAKASKTLHNYANTIAKDKEETTKQVKTTTLKESEYNLEQMNYAIEEMKEACRLLDNADLSKLSNYERMIRFGTASLDRARGLKLNENSELACHLSWIEESGNSVRNITATLNNLITDIRNEKEAFAPYSHATLEEKQNALSKLEDLIKKEESSNHLNKTTLDNVKKIIANCYDMIKTDSKSESTTSVDSKEKTETNKNVITKGTPTTETSTDTESDNTISGVVNTSSQTNISTAVDASVQADINNTITTETQVDMGVGTDSIIQTDEKNTKAEKNRNDFFEEITNPIKSTVHNNLDIKNKVDAAIGDDTIVDYTDAQTIANKEKTEIVTEIKNPIKVSIGSESVSSIKPMVITKIFKAPVSAIATQTDIPRVSAVATQTDIPRVSSVATQTDIIPVSAVASQTSTNHTESKNIKTINLKENKETKNKDIKNNIEENSNNDATSQPKKNINTNKNRPFGWLGLGLLSTLVCVVLKKFI